jgi:PAS domain S-box-containing protein
MKKSRESLELSLSHEEARAEVEQLRDRLSQLEAERHDEQEAQQEICGLAEFPQENPFPVMRITEDGILLYANKASEPFLQAWNRRLSQSVPEAFLSSVREALTQSAEREFDSKIEERIISFVAVPVPGRGYVNLYGRDVTERRRLEDALHEHYDLLELRVAERTKELSSANALLHESQGRTQATNALLWLFAEKTSRQAYLDAVVRLLRDWSGCRCVGIRIRNEQDHVPYKATLGFDDDFLKEENDLSLLSDHCACIRVIKGAPEPQEMAAMTQAGSFRSNNTFEFVAGLSEAENRRYRGACMRNGYGSLAVIPIRYQDKILAAIHLADEGLGKVPPQTVEFIESMTSVVGEALYRFDMEAELTKYRDHLEELVQERAAEVNRAHRRIVEILETINDSFISLDREWRFTYLNRWALQLTGKSLGEVLGRSIWEVFPQIIGTRLETQYRRAMAERQALNFENLSDVSRGSWFDLSIYPTGDGLALIGRDITERKRVEMALRESEGRLKRAQEIAHLGSWELDLDSNELSWSDEVYRIFGLAPQQFGATYEAFLDMVHPDDRAAVDAAYSGSLREGRDSYEIEHRVVRRTTGEVRWVQEKCSHRRDAAGRIIGSLGMVLDITDRKSAEAKIMASLKEKEILLREIHHRVKNNLQIIYSLISLQTSRLTDPTAGLILRDSQNRIQSIAQVHDQLYRSEDTASIRFAEYVGTMTQYLFNSYAVDLQRIALVSHTQDIVLPMDLALPCGLIVHELVSNALKHAFPAGRKGNIFIDLESLENDTVVLTIADDGVGFPADLDLRKSKTLGLQLVAGLSEQLGGSLKVLGQKGTRSTLTFPLKRA